VRLRRSRSHSVWAASSVLVLCTGIARAGHAQACCAGGAAVTPGRLELYEQGLMGLELKAGEVFGAFDSGGRFAPLPPQASELDLEQDLFGVVRVLERGQVSVLLPLVETRRTSGGLTDFGGGIGDVNAAVRYDVTLAGDSRVVPGVALLAGATFPTGKPADAAGLGPLASGATGIGAYQINAGLALEQVFGPWLVNATGIVAQRTARTVGPEGNQVHERLAAQTSWLAALAYTFPSDIALAVSASYLMEGNATINGVEDAGTGHRLPTLTLSGLVPLRASWRLDGGVFGVLPLRSVGLNQPASIGLFVTVLRSWNSWI
jgi:hypothetical protein